ncbi:MAG: hypothetical protein ACJ741_19180 [Pyrinomonadaceae bacterium]
MTTGGDTETRRRGTDFETPASPRSRVSDRSQRDEAAPAEAQRAHSTVSIELPTLTQPRLALNARAGARLSQVLIGKSLVETLFVVALAALFSYTHFNPRLRGTLDAADARAVAGWVVDEAAPDRLVEVELYIDDHFVARRRAVESRPDVLAAGRAPSAEHGYVFQTPPLSEGEHEARVFAVEHAGGDPSHTALVQVGDALKFTVRAGETNGQAPEKWWENLENR